MGGVNVKGKNSTRRGHLSAKRTLVAIVLISSLALLLTCSDAIFDAMRQMAATANQATPFPDTKKRSASGSEIATVITAHEVITLTFTKAMNAAAVSVSGDLGPLNTDTVRWDPTSGNTVLNLNEARAAVWTAGTDKTVTVTVTDSGETVTYSFLYTVFSGVCVSPPTDTQNPGVSGNKGTTIAPLDTIQAGIDMAKTIYLDHSKGPAEVRVAKGTFQSNYHDTTKPVALMIEGISLKGGYSSKEWSTVDTILNESIMEDTSITSGSGIHQNRAVEVPATVTAATTLQGFTIKLAKGVENSGIYCLGSPQISSNKVMGRASLADASGINQQYGIYCSGTAAQPSIHNDAIDAGWNGNVFGDQSYGIYIALSSSPIIEDNSIDGGDGGTTCAIWAFNASTSPNPRVSNNTIDSGTGTEVLIGSSSNIGVYTDVCHPSIEGNTFITSADAMTPTCAIYEAYTGSDPEKVVNNHFNFDWGLFYRDYNGSETTVSNLELNSKTVTTLQGTDKLSAWGNY